MGRLGDAFGTLCSVIFKGTSLVIFSTIVFVIVILVFFQLYQRLYSITYEESEKQHISEYASRFLLSSREQEVLSLIIKGRSNSEIANELCVTESTVKFHVGNIFKKTNQHNKQELQANYKSTTLA
jgi:DNA-binding NarL/FixJ family response regulator